MAKKISLINMKGGVGKSTLTINLAWQFAAYTSWNKKVLVVDLDPQFNASQYLIGVERYKEIINKNHPTIWDIFEQHSHSPFIDTKKIIDKKSVIYNVISYSNGSKIDLIPSRLELAYSMRNPAQKEILLKKFLSECEDEYDLILIDCAPTESILTTAAYLSSDYILVPVKPEYLSSIGLPLLVRSMDEFIKGPYGDHKIELAGIVFNAVTNYSPEEIKAKDDVKKIAKHNDWYVFNAQVSYSRSYPKGAREGKPIFSTSYSRTEQAMNFHSFAKEFAQRIDL